MKILWSNKYSKKIIGEPKQEEDANVIDEGTDVLGVEEVKDEETEKKLEEIDEKERIRLFVKEV